MLNWTKSTKTPITIAILLFDRFSNLCLANLMEPMRAANTLAGRELYQWQILTMDGGVVQSSSGLPVMGEAAISDMAKCDYLFVNCSYDHDRHDSPLTRRALRAAAGRARVVAGLDSGAWLMAAAGLLDGRRATVHWDLWDAFSERFLDVDAIRSRFLLDGNRITCAGAMSAYDLSLALIQSHFGAVMKLDLEGFFIQSDPPLDRSAHAPSDPVVRRALGVMRDHVETPLPLGDISARAGVPAKTLHRRFSDTYGAPPGQVYRHIRLSLARQLVEGGGLPIAEIAVRCGYENASAMTRAFKAHFGVPPQDLRSKLHEIGAR